MHTNTLLHPLALRRAEPHDLPGVLTLLADTAEWLYAQGVRQWPRNGFGPERIEPLIEERVLFLLDDELRYLDPDESAPPVATIALDDHADPEFWTPGDDPGAALYIHKLAVARPWSGSGLGDALLDWAAASAFAAGLPWLRLDCAKANPRLQSYYRSRGFHHVRTVDLPHRSSGALFQRPSEDLSTTAFRDLTIAELISA
ncbi:ribosomal protein S18 acetylase RimI-like enzyme [Nonomuraea polychroma]|jgi:ribosomal protein S18 acetylase RimI-like enzyme|uniref:Ribosomal protein S18 acetylase RimI-like enzyme n=1 Tax=Nonomuraea polychroma TaxID=46176 RepID=A0A438LWU9_9ACTN|nr:GNAT family N-acetyltransferase [Nonomuraea polychroma]RVX38004.1 ribosomal protein S18 acetylase RimI-like enzyme [Nonomuraea polychroma]